jgi:hypothetical protein
MLEGAEKCQNALELMEELDEYYGPTLWDNKNSLGPPNCDDWARIRVFLKFLEIFYEATIRGVQNSPAPANPPRPTPTRPVNNGYKTFLKKCGP